MSIETDVADFMKRTRGVNAWTVARALNRSTGGIDWRGCSRGHMAEEWAKARSGSVYSYTTLKYVTLDQLCDHIKVESTYGRR